MLSDLGKYKTENSMWRKSGRERTAVSHHERDQIIAGHLHAVARRKRVHEVSTGKELAGLKSRKGEDGVGN